MKHHLESDPQNQVQILLAKAIRNLEDVREVKITNASLASKVEDLVGRFKKEVSELHKDALEDMGYKPRGVLPVKPQVKPPLANKLSLKKR